jgi:cholesterol oxidase
VHIPEGVEAARRLAEQLGGFAGTNSGESLGMAMTAHFLGGRPIGADPEHDVIDPYQRLYGHPGISVVHGLAVSANLGVNPSPDDHRTGGAGTVLLTRPRRGGPASGAGCAQPAAEACRAASPGRSGGGLR